MLIYSMVIGAFFISLFPTLMITMEGNQTVDLDQRILYSPHDVVSMEF